MLTHAWFSPFPPVRTGVAACSADAVEALRARGHSIDLYPEQAAHDFPWRHRRRPYDLVIYQFGNSSHHDYIWPYALRYPGLTVLHDTRLHHARAALLLREKRRHDYRRELAWSEPDVPADAAELAIAGFDSRLYYDWPLVRGLVVASRLVAVHGQGTRRELIEALSIPNDPTSNSQAANAQAANSQGSLGEKIVSIRLGHGEIVTPEREREARARIRGRYGIAADAIVFGVFGGLTPEKRLPQIVEALRAIAPYAPDARLLLAGAAAPHYDLGSLLASAPDRIVVTGFVDDRELTDHVAAVDVSLNMRWPTARETSGPWLRALAAGKPTVVTELLQLTDVPTLDPRTWRVAPPSVIGHRSSAAAGTASAAAVTIAIDIVDEDHSLRLAMRRLATDAGLRAELGLAAQTYWRQEHSIEAMAGDYERLLSEMGPAPEHCAPVGDEQLQKLLRPFGIESPL